MNRVERWYWWMVAAAVIACCWVVYQGILKIVEIDDRQKKAAVERVLDERERGVTPIEEVERAERAGEIIPNEARRIVAFESGMFYNVRRFSYEDGVECVIFTSAEKGGISCNWPEVEVIE